MVSEVIAVPTSRLAELEAFCEAWMINVSAFELFHRLSTSIHRLLVLVRRSPRSITFATVFLKVSNAG